MAAIVLQPARTPAVHVSLSVFTFQTANSMLPRQRRSPWPRPGADRFSLVRGSGAPLACAAARGRRRTGLRPLQRALVHSLQASWRWQGFVAGRGRPRTPACQRRLLAPAKTAAPTTEMVIPAGFFKGEGALFSPPRFHRRPRVPAEPALAALGPGGSVGVALARLSD